ncbi:hypothetical protein AAIH70_24365 [Neorhizobium sp. BT27B]|uniref:hypothetical protein n=1 Tax=Neorhizobium sp. BT27B TaxID=3142625 RepID=UPI003D29477D
MASIPTRIEFPREFVPYLPDAVVRFRYLNPRIQMETGEAFVVLSSDGDEPKPHDLERQFLFCLYRQKVYAETLALRTTLIAGVTGG